MKAKSKTVKIVDLNKINTTLVPKDKSPVASYIELDGKEMTVEYSRGRIQMHMPTPSAGIGIWGRFMSAWNTLLRGTAPLHVDMSPKQAQSVMNALRRHLKTLKALGVKGA